MVNLNIQENGQFTYAEYVIQPNDRVDNLTLGMMVNNDIKGFATVSPIQLTDKQYYKYNVTSMVTMRNYLGENIKRERILSVFINIAKTFLEASEYMINQTSFVLDEENIYVDEKTGDVKMICIPLLSASSDGNICNFFKTIMFTSQFDLDENQEYIGKLITYLNPKSFSIQNFIDELDGLINEGIDEKSNSDNDEKDSELKEDKSQKKQNDDVEEKAAKYATDSFYSYDASEYKDSVETSDTLEGKPHLLRLRNKKNILIDKDEFLIGRNEAKVDYAVRGNGAIESIHAAIIKRENEYFVVDKNSKNHTYLNRVLIGSDEEIFLPHGAQIRFADEDYEFRTH